MSIYKSYLEQIAFCFFVTSCSLTLLYSHITLLQMSKAFLDEDGLLPPLLEITHINQEEKVLLTGLACLINILSEKYKIIRLVEAGLVAVVRPLSGHDDERVQQFVAGILFAISSSPGLEEWLVSPRTYFYRPLAFLYLY